MLIGYEEVLVLTEDNKKMEQIVYGLCNMFKNIHLPSGPLAWMANLVKSVLNLAAGPDVEEVDGAVLSTLEHLHVTTNTYK